MISLACRQTIDIVRQSEAIVVPESNTIFVEE